MKSSIQNIAPLDMPHPVWMSQEGDPLYGKWAKAVLTGAEDSSVWANYTRLTENVSPGIVQGVVLDPHNVVRTLLRADGGLLPDADSRVGASERLLLPRSEEILHYTSAQTFLKEGVPENVAVATHARDSLRFAIAIAAGLVDDVFTVRTQEARLLLNQLMGKSITNIPSDISATAKAIRKILGPLWDSSLEESGMEQNPDGLERVFGLHRLAFIAKSLRSRSLHACLEDFSVTAFGQLGDPSIILDTRWLEPAEGKGGVKYAVHGWQYRAHHFGLLTASRPSQPKAVLAYDAASGRFSASPTTIKYLREALKRQNQQGLREPTKSAGNVRSFAPPISVGCPVHNLGSIAATAHFGASVFEHMTSYHLAHPLA